MISIIPSLDFMRSLCGTYQSPEGTAELRVWSCGYGVAIDLKGEKKTELVGVVGAFNNVVECFVQIGLPNVIRFVGQKTADASIEFIAEDPPFSIVLVKQSGKAFISISLGGEEKVSYVLQSVRSSGR
jgi:hypothetical protein